MRDLIAALFLFVSSPALAQTSGAFLIGTGTPSGSPYQFQAAYNADPFVGPPDTRQSMFQTTLSYSATSTNIWENLNSFVTVNGPGIASGEINTIHSFLQVNVGANAAVAEGFESSALNNGTIGTFTSYLGLTNNGAAGTATSIHGMDLYLNNLNTTPGAVGVWAGLNIGPMIGGGAKPTFYSAIRIPDANAGIVTLGGILIGGLGNATPGGLFIQGADNSGGTFPVTVKNLAAAIALLVSNSSIVSMPAAGVNIQPSSIGPNMAIIGSDNSAGTFTLSLKNLAGTNMLSVNNAGGISVGATPGVTCAGITAGTVTTANGIITHC